MKLLSTVATLFLSAALVIAAGPIKARQGCSGGFITFDGPNFTGNQQTVNGGNQCSAIPSSFKANVASVRAPAGCVCYFSTQDSCGDCGACVGEGGFGDLSSLPNLGSFRCVDAGSGGCANSNCPIKN